MKKLTFIFTLLTLCLILTCSVFAQEATPEASIASNFDGFLKVAYPIDTNIDNNDVFNVNVTPNFYIEAEVGYTHADLVRGYIGFDAIEDIHETYTIGAEVFIARSPIGIFIEHQERDSHISPDNDISLIGFVVRY